MASIEESSESDGEMEPARCFYKRLSTNKQMAESKCIKEGYLFKKGLSFQRWKRRYFKLKSRRLFYSKDSEFRIFNEIELIDATVAEYSLKNINQSFQVITPSRNLILSTESRRDMEEWIGAIRAAAANDFYDPRQEQTELNTDHHNWCAFPNVRPFYCNVCGEGLSGMKRSGATFRGLSCEVCKFKTHKHCASKVTFSCKWMTLASIGNYIIEEDDGTVLMPHQWMTGNLPVNSKCSVCDKTCGSIRRLQDCWCLWCHSTVHSSCRDGFSRECSLGQCQLSVLPPTAITSLDSDGFWQATKTPGTSPLLVFINSKSGDNQGVKMLRKFKQLLNPAQVFDLMSGGPKMGLRLFQNFESFRVLVCGGDGSISWVLSEIDKLDLHTQCQVGVLPLGTGNDLARVLGWGSTFDDDSQLPNVLEQLEHAQIKMLDRWSVNCYRSSDLGQQHRLSLFFDPIALNDSIANHLFRILHSDSNDVVISSAMFLCSIVRELVDKVTRIREEDTGEDSIGDKCSTLKEKLSALLKSLGRESAFASNLSLKSAKKTEALAVGGNDQRLTELAKNSDEIAVATRAYGGVQPEQNQRRKRCQTTVFQPREQLMSRANSLKKAFRQIIEYTEKVVDEQNVGTLEFETDEVFQSSEAVLPPHLDKHLAANGLDPEAGGYSARGGGEPFCRSSVSSPEIGLNHLSVISETDPDAAVNDRSYLSVPLRQSLSYTKGRAAVLQSLTSSDMLSPGAISMSPLFKRTTFPGMLYRSSQMESKATASRRISSLSKFKRANSLTTHVSDRLPTKDTVSFPILNIPLLQTLPGSVPCGDNASGGLGFISRKLLESADAVCAAVSPFAESEDILPNDYEEKCVMNNYFGIGLDAKIALEFHNKREEHPEKCRSRTKNMMWFGVLGGREIYQRTFKNLEQKVRLECDGHLIQLPNLQGIVVLNIPSYMGGTNFWGATRGTEGFIFPSFDDHVLEVVAVFDSIQLGMSRVFNLQKHRIAQCRSVKIAILGNEGIPVQVDGEAWVQPPGLICISLKNRTQMLTRDKVFAEALRTWTEKQKSEQPIGRKNYFLSDEEFVVLKSFVDATKSLLSSVKMASLDQAEGLQHISQLAAQSSKFLDRLNLQDSKPVKRSLISDFVSSVRALYQEAHQLAFHKDSVLKSGDTATDIEAAVTSMEAVMEKVYDVEGFPHFQIVKNESLDRRQTKVKDRNASRKKHSRAAKEKSTELQRPNVLLWSVEDVSQWLHHLNMDEYRDIFVAHDIRGPELITLSRSDLKDLGISKVGHSKRILEAINDLKKDKDRVTSSSTSSSLSSFCKGNQMTL